MTHQCDDIENVWNVLCEASTQGHIIIASYKEERGKPNPEEVYKAGLNPFYGNAVLDVSFTVTSPSQTRSIKLRNIWNEEYTWEGKYK